MKITEINGRGGSLMGAASTNVERHLGDIVDGMEDMDEVRNAVYELAHDGVIDAGGNPAQASSIAKQLAAGY